MSAPEDIRKQNMTKQLEYAQQQLKAFEDIGIGNTTAMKEGPGPGWLGGTAPPLYERIWVAVQTSAGLASTPALSPLLLTSGLPTDTLGYIWALANHTVPGALTRNELYSVLALVALAQSGCVVNNLGSLHNLAQAPIPTLDLSRLPPRIAVPRIFPSSLSVTSLPEPNTMSWSSQEASQPSLDKIGISYISSNLPMVSPNLFSEQSRQPMADLDPLANTVGFNSVVTGDKSVNSGYEPKTNLYSKHSSNNFTFSFPILSESPTNLREKPDETVEFDDEFTDFQSANCSIHDPPVQNSVVKIDGDKFSSFQQVPPKFDPDDLSVLVVGGKNIPTAQQLWVTERELPADQKNDKIPDKLLNVLCDLSNTYVKDPEYCLDIEPSLEMNPNRDAFQDIKKDKLSAIHNPLPELEVDTNIEITLNAEEIPFQTATVFNRSLISSSGNAVDLFSNDNPESFSSESKILVKEDDDDEFCNFQNFHSSLPTLCNDTLKTVDKYEVLRTFTCTDSSQEQSGFNNSCNTTTKLEFSNQHLTLIVNNSCENEQDNCLLSKDTSEQYNNTETDSFQESVHPTSQRITGSGVDNVLPTISLSEKCSEKDQQTVISSDSTPAEDKYEALRLLETNDDEFGDFGEFLGAESTSSGAKLDWPKAENEPSSIQIRCLEVCLDLLKSGHDILSKSTSEAIAEVLSNPRANNYLHCLLEVNRVSQRVRCHLGADTCSSLMKELDSTWQNLTPFFSHSENNQMAEAEGGECIICRCRVGPAPVTFGAQSFHAPCANLYLHCIQPTLPNINATSNDSAIIMNV